MKAFLGVAVVLMAVLVPAAPAYAHAQLLAADPAPGSHLDRPPAQILLRFSETVRPQRDGVRLLDGKGNRVGQAQPAQPPGHADEVTLALPSISDGYYTVVWRVTSDDSHPINGSYAFAVGAATGPAVTGQLLTRSDTDTSVAVAYGVVRWLGYAAVAVVVGGIFFVFACWPARRPSRRARRIILAGCSTALAGALGSLILQGPYVSGTGLAGVLDPALLADTVGSRYGIAVLARCAVLVGIGLAWYWRPGDRALSRQELAAWAAAGLALPITWVVAGHAGAGPLLQWVTDTVHLSAVAVWLGGLVMLTAAVLPASAQTPTADAAVAVRRFSAVATAAVGAVVVTGFTQAWLELGSLAALVSSYGQLLFVKLAAVGVLVSLGAVSRSVVRSRTLAAERAGRTAREQRTAALARLRNTVRTEAVVAALVLAVTAALVATPPGTHRDSVAVAAAPGAAVIERDLALPGGGRVAVRIDPAQIGSNEISLTVYAADGSPWDVPEVTGRLSQTEPMPVTFTRSTPGAFSSAVLIPRTGIWHLVVLVRTTDVDVADTATDLTIA